MFCAERTDALAALHHLAHAFERHRRGVEVPEEHPAPHAFYYVFRNDNMAVIPRLRIVAEALNDALDRRVDLSTNQSVSQVHRTVAQADRAERDQTVTPSSWRRVDGVEAML